MRDVKCERCGKSTATKQKKKRFCSDRCRLEAWVLRKAEVLNEKK